MAILPMFYLSKVIQAFAIGDVAYALFVGVTHGDGMGRELKLMLLGIVVFVVGRLLEQHASV